MTDSTLTDRYVEAATRSLPIEQRRDHADELRSAIRDQIDGRIDGGDEPDAAEKGVLSELGDPAVLAAGYAGRPLHLLGPRWYLTWKRILRLILLSALPPIALGAAIGFAVEGRPFGSVLIGAVGITLTVAASIFAITTVVFMRLDRAQAPRARWTVDALPALRTNEGGPPGRDERGIGIIAVVWAVLGMILISVPWELPGIGRMSVLNAALWPWSLVVGIVLIITGAIVSARARALGQWTIRSGFLNAVIAVVWAALVIGLTAAGRLFDRAFVDLIDIDLDAQRAIAVCLIAGAIAVAGWSMAYGFREARRHRSRSRSR